MFVAVSRTTPLGHLTADPINLITQFYLPENEDRLAELQVALRANVTNPCIDSITLLNEREFSAFELGIRSSKITQIVLGRRLRFSDALAARRLGYTVLANADIYVDQSVASVRRTDLHLRRAMFALLRYEKGKLFGPRADSQDTWIIHSSAHITPAEMKSFQFELGRPGCDNKVCYLFATMGFDVYNDPALIRTHHYHDSSSRNYPDTLPPPYLHIYPANSNLHNYHQINTYDFVSCNVRLAAYIRSCKGAFVVPRVAGIENNTAYLAAVGDFVPDCLRQVMKTNAGIYLADTASVNAYSQAYLKAFQCCELYASWETWSNYFPHIQMSQPYIQKTFQKPQVGAFVFDIFHYLSAPWTQALRGRRLLIVSPFVDMFQAQPPAYQTDLFPDCSFVYLKPPQTHGTEPSRDWTLEFADLCSAVDALDFDVALCSCGGYGNPLCGHIFSTGRSAIYVGGVLQMYFGIYGNRWLKERKDMMSIHLTTDWKRPTIKPIGHASIESGCYW
jgi:hypothetical protein